MARRISFWATKKIKKPTIVCLRMSDGSVAKFKATKIVRKPTKLASLLRKRDIMEKRNKKN